MFEYALHVIVDINKALKNTSSVQVKMWKEVFVLIHGKLKIIHRDHFIYVYLRKSSLRVSG